MAAELARKIDSSQNAGDDVRPSSAFSDDEVARIRQTVRFNPKIQSTLRISGLGAGAPLAGKSSGAKVLPFERNKPGAKPGAAAPAQGTGLAVPTDQTPAAEPQNIDGISSPDENLAQPDELVEPNANEQAQPEPAAAQAEPNAETPGQAPEQPAPGQALTPEPQEQQPPQQGPQPLPEQQVDQQNEPQPENQEQPGEAQVPAAANADQAADAAKEIRKRVVGKLAVNLAFGGLFGFVTTIPVLIGLDIYVLVGLFSKNPALHQLGKKQMIILGLFNLLFALVVILFIYAVFYSVCTGLTGVVVKFFGHFINSFSFCSQLGF